MVLDIYGSRQEKTINNFIGKDVWVYARITKERIRGWCKYDYGYIKALSENDHIISCLWLSEYNLSTDGAYHCTQKSKDRILDTNSPLELSEWSIKLCKPIEMARTDDLFIIDQADQGES